MNDPIKPPSSDSVPTREEADGALATQAGRARFLAKVSETLLSSLDCRQTLQRLSDLVISRMQPRTIGSPPP